jgi:MFS family permease
MGFCVEQIGRKGAILLLTLPLLVGWILIAFGDTLIMLYSGRFLVGFVAGAYTVGVPIYINEIALESIRGRLSLMASIGIHVGICYPYIAGCFLPYNFLALSLALVPIVIVIMMAFVVESPRYLLGKGQLKEATKALIWLRGIDDVQEEVNLVRKTCLTRPS